MCVSEIAFIFTCLVKWVLDLLKVDMPDVALCRICLMEIIEGEYLRHCWRVDGVEKNHFKIAKGDGNVGWIG